MAQPLQALDVVQLHELVLGGALGITPEKLSAQSNIEYVKSMADAVSAVRGGAVGAVAGAAGALAPNAAFLMNPTPVAQVLEVARANVRMPQKSTYFLPKITTGWTFHVHDAPSLERPHRDVFAKAIRVLDQDLALAGADLHVLVR